MKTLYIECKMGVAGDMLMSALFELLNIEKQNQFLEIMNNILPDIISVTATKGMKNGITGSKIHVLIYNMEEVDFSHTKHYDTGHKHSGENYNEQKHYSYLSLCEKITHLNLSHAVKEKALEIYKLIAEAEAKVHNTEIKDVHFHEVGSLDAMADVVGNCILIDMISPDKIICSPIHVGNGTVKCAHGILPVPAPATSVLLNEIPYYTGDIMSELCTPTGAAIVKSFADSFGNMPAIIFQRIGIGLGTKDFPQANIVRVFFSDEDLSNEASTDSDIIYELSCNLDDMTGEELGFAMEILMEKGALDVFYIPIQMKKNRPGILLKVFCKQNELDKFRDLIFMHTSTRGIRYREYNRFKLEANYSTKETAYGNITIKHNNGYGINKEKAEFEDLKKLAVKNNISLYEIKKGL